MAEHILESYWRMNQPDSARFGGGKRNLAESGLLLDYLPFSELIDYIIFSQIKGELSFLLFSGRLIPLFSPLSYFLFLRFFWCSSQPWWPLPRHWYRFRILWSTESNYILIAKVGLDFWSQFSQVLLYFDFENFHLRPTCLRCRTHKSSGLFGVCDIKIIHRFLINLNDFDNSLMLSIYIRPKDLFLYKDCCFRKFFIIQFWKTLLFIYRLLIFLIFRIKLLFYL